ncbi:MAG: PKD domain-containing protein [Candidatus Aminicenantes bacterium]|nr:MAG: PKD domain-containing protein [Candidatus Aminicenantes bacterium]
MKKFKFLLVFLVLFSVTFSFAAKKNGATLISSSADEVVLRFEVNTYDFENVLTPKGQAKKLLAPKTGITLKKGAPEVAKLTSSVIIPDEAEMRVDVLNSSFTEITGIDIAPSKGNLLRTVDPDTVPYEYGAEYRTDAFFPGNLAEIAKPYIIRDFRGQAITVYPFQYNPVTRVLRVYDKIKVKVSTTGRVGENIFKSKKPKGKLQREFKNLYQRHFINFPEAELTYTPLPDPFGNMLIVCYSDFMDEMAPFVTWKQSISYNVDLVDYSTIGSSAALKTYVANYYNTNGLTYLLLVGDHAQVPTSSTSSGDSDNNYGYIVGNDHYLDIFVGRFSAETSAHVTTQVERTIHYERDVLSSAEFFRHSTGMGSAEGPGHNGEYDYQHVNLLLADLAGYGYTTHTNHQTGGSVSNLTNLINSGQGCLWYCGHGSTTCWACGWSFCNSNVDGLVNEYELPFIVSVACVVGNFKNYTCFCEAWQRATNNGNPTGSVVHAGSTINQSWNPPMDAQDEMVDLLVSESGPKRTFGGMFANGLFKMIDINGPGGESMADTWTCFGDPSVQLRTPGTPDGPVGGNQPPNADFSYVTDLLQVTFTDLSDDPDGWIVSWDWDFGDTNTSPLQHPVHTYASSGTYSVTLTVTDNEDATDYITKDVTVSDGTTPEIYVFDISMTAYKRGANYWADAIITIKDTNGNVVPDATVDVTWSGVVSGTDSDTTGSGGTVTFTSSTAKKKPGPFTITVNNVTHATMNYNPALNNETTDSVTY